MGLILKSRLGQIQDSTFAKYAHLANLDLRLVALEVESRQVVAQSRQTRNRIDLALEGSDGIFALVSRTNINLPLAVLIRCIVTRNSNAKSPNCVIESMILST